MSKCWRCELQRSHLAHASLIIYEGAAPLGTSTTKCQPGQTLHWAIFPRPECQTSATKMDGILMTKSADGLDKDSMQKQLS